MYITRLAFIVNTKRKKHDFASGMLQQSEKRKGFYWYLGEDFIF